MAFARHKEDVKRALAKGPCSVMLLGGNRKHALRVNKTKLYEPQGHVQTYVQGWP